MGLYFFKHLDLVNWGFFDKLIINCNPKFLSRFKTALFTKLRVKLFYNIVYHPQTDGSNKQANQIIKIALCFLVYVLENLFYLSKILIYI